MSRYIDADILKDLYQPIDGKDYNVNMAIIRANIDDTPTADVQEVKHGKWKKDEFGDIICSECKQYPIENEDGYQITELKEYKPLYCPECGAKMDGEGE